MKRPPMRIRSGSGLGDAIYLRCICEHFARAGERVVACTDYPEVFLGSNVETDRFSRERITTVAHYTAGKSRPDTTQW